MNILILGGSGFVGSRLTELLIKEEFEEFETEYDRIVLSMANVWNNIKKNAPEEEMLAELKKMMQFATFAAAELMQTIAMIMTMGEFETKLINLAEDMEKTTDGK